MYFDRGALKRRAKHLVTQGNPPAYMVTLIFLLATTALATVVGLFLPNPVDQVDACISIGLIQSWRTAARSARAP